MQKNADEPQGRGARCQNYKQQSCWWQLGGYKAWKLLMHTDRNTLTRGRQAHDHWHKEPSAHTDANTQQLSVGFQNKGINHHYTYKHKHRTRLDRALMCLRDSSKKKAHWHQSAAFTDAGIATKVKWSKAVRTCMTRKSNTLPQELRGNNEVGAVRIE